MKEKFVICLRGINFFKCIESTPLGCIPVWCSLKDAMVFESKAAAQDFLFGYWFDNCRKWCVIKSFLSSQWD